MAPVTGTGASPPRSPLRVFVVAGEPSGDLLGGRVMQALADQVTAAGGPWSGVRYAGVGGARMQAAGLDSLFPLDELAVMGLAEVLPRLPRLLRRLDQTVAAVRAFAPHLLLTIDAPDFSLRVAARVKALGLPARRIHLVAPSVWAWRPGRARTLAGILDHLLALLPFEPPYFQREGLACTFIGHPVLESAAACGDGPAFRKAHGIAPAAPLLVALPGSRKGEVSRLLPLFGETVARLRRQLPGLVVAVPTVERMEAPVAQAAAAWAAPVHVLTDEAAKFAAFAAGNAALAASGTVALELAMARLPAVITYRLNPLTGFLARRLLTLRWVSLVNILLEREVMPEYLLDRARPDTLAPALFHLLTEPVAQAAQHAGAADALARLGSDDPLPPSVRAARCLLACVAGMPA